MEKIFAVTFGMGAASGIVMSYQFGTNWSVFADKTGAILGPLTGYEVLVYFMKPGYSSRRPSEPEENAAIAKLHGEQ